MGSRPVSPALVAHGGAGPSGPAADRVERRRGMLEAVQRGADILRGSGNALDAVVAVLVALENHPLFNAGTGSLLTTDGTVEMDASVMVAASDERANRVGSRADSQAGVMAGAVAAVTRVRNPIQLARAVMERTPHVLVVGSGAERLARRVGLALCSNEELITERARERWRQQQESAQLGIGAKTQGHGTVGAAAIDCRGTIAAATSTGGVPGKIPGRVGDSAIIGAGTYADKTGGASATGNGEAIITRALCREAVMNLRQTTPMTAVRRVISRTLVLDGAQGGIILVDRRGRIGFAHNAAAMEVATFTSLAGIRHLWPDSIKT